MTNKTVLITGANTGIGKETARQLAARGATVILACRDERKAKQAMLDIMKSNTNAKLFFLQLDLSSFESVRKAAQTFATMDLRNDTTNYNTVKATVTTNNKLDVLINNAGVMFSEKQMSQDGFEMCLQANHLGHFLFTLLLLPHIMNHHKPPSKARILNLTSITYKMATASGGEFNFQDYNCNDRPYTLFTTYSQSKLANILFTKELARRYPDTIVSLAINPGIVRTDVTRNMSSFLQYGNYLFGFLVRWYQKNPTEGAYSSVWAATTPTTLLPNGSFVSNSKPESTLEYCHNETAAKKLWEWSAQMVQWKSN
ncbi:retinol dehydrogenase [Fragilaria crotonensis]|nr:retinol dehydrogenase [Fragilaria crotonensis]